MREAERYHFERALANHNPAQSALHDQPPQHTPGAGIFATGCGDLSCLWVMASQRTVTSRRTFAFSCCITILRLPSRGAHSLGRAKGSSVQFIALLL